MPHRIRPVADPLVTLLIRFSSWFFGYGAPGIDLVLAMLAAGWAVLMVGRPDLFDQGSFIGMSWLPDPAWIAITVALSLAHGFGLRRPDWLNWRMLTLLGSGWMWLCVAASFLRVDVGTGVFAYSIFGFVALLAAIYVGGLPRRAT